MEQTNGINEIQNELTKARVRVLMQWAYISGKENINKHVFDEATEEIIQNMSWESR